MTANTLKEDKSFLALRVKGSQGWRNRDYCCLGVSLRSPNFEGDRLRLIIDFINWNFKECIIDLSDTLHRHNLIQDGYTEAQAKDICEKEGNEWIEKHYDILTNLKIPTKIIRWDYWLEHPEYQANLKAFKTAFDNDNVFKENLDQDIDRFLKRQAANGNAIDPVSFYENSKNYLIEELACHSILYAENENYANLYPGRQHDCYKVVRSGDVQNVPNGLKTSHYTRLLFYTSRAMNDNIVEIKNYNSKNPKK